jgi:hypothetical protein
MILVTDSIAVLCFDKSFFKNETYNPLLILTVANNAKNCDKDENNHQTQVPHSCKIKTKNGFYFFTFY